MLILLFTTYVLQSNFDYLDLLGDQNKVWIIY